MNKNIKWFITNCFFFQILTEEDVENTIVDLYTPHLDLSRGLYGTMTRDEELQRFKTKSKKVIVKIYDAADIN